MLTNKLTIVPVTLDPITNESPFTISPQITTEPSCIIRTATAEISFFNGIDERIIHTVMKELDKK